MEAENRVAALNNQIAQLQREKQEQSERLEARHRQELEKLRMAIQRHENDQRRLETEIQALGDRAKSESNVELRRQLASVQESLRVTQQDLYERQNQQAEQQQALKDAKQWAIDKLRESSNMPAPAGQRYPDLNQQGNMSMPSMMGQMPNASFGQGMQYGQPTMSSPPMGQPNASYGYGIQYGQSTMSNPQSQPSEGGAGYGNYEYPGNYGYPVNYGYPGNNGYPANYGNPDNDGNQSNQSNDDGQDSGNGA